MKNGMKKLTAFVLILALMLTLTPAALADAVSHNPLVDPWTVNYVDTEDEFVHVLLLGNDHGYAGYWGSGSKKDLMECHTDAVMVVSFNLTKGRVEFFSIPRDTFTYVPGVYGIYKLNAAFNCAATVEEGIQHCLESASYLLGGIRIDKYFMVDMGAMVALTQLLGNVEFDMDMQYTGHSGTTYDMGLLTLAGMGIMDYVRARRNATQTGKVNDIGRTERTRNMMITLFKFMQGRTDLIAPIYDLINSHTQNIYTNVTQEEVESLLDFIQGVGAEDIGSYVMSDDTSLYDWGMGKWLFTFTDQQHRKEAIKAAYGLDVEEIPYMSQAYSLWLEHGTDDELYQHDVTEGFTQARSIRIARQVMNYARSLPSLTADQQSALDAAVSAHDAAVTAFDTAADSENPKQAANNSASYCIALQNAIDRLAAAVGYTEMPVWNTTRGWWQDPYVQQYPNVNWE